MEKFICPVCKGKLVREGNSLVCGSRHLYDLSKKGYVNLLMSQKSSDAHHGDSKEMVLARSRFLDGGFYEKLRSEIIGLLCPYLKEGTSVLDIGCGECYYTSGIYEAFREYHPVFYGIDISKEALIAGMKRNRNLCLAVASAFEVPVADSSFDILLNLFAPHSEDEYRRILKPSGLLLRVFPAENHLWELKEAIYENPYRNETAKTEIEGFRTDQDLHLTFPIQLNNNEEIRSLFSMTPYSYKTSSEDEKKLDRLTTLSATADFRILTYIKE